MRGAAYFEKALDFFQQGALAQAKQTCRLGLAQAPANFEGWRLLALIYQRGGQSEAALTALHQALRLAPEAAVLYCDLGHFRAESKAPDLARSAYRKALVCDPDYWLAWLGLGQLEAEWGTVQAAWGAWWEVLQREPFQYEALLGILEILRRQKNWQAAEQIVQKALSASCFSKAQRARLLTQQGVLWQDQGLFQAALGAFAQARVLLPELADACFGQGSVFQEQGERELARAAYLECLKLQPLHAEAQLNLGLLDLSESKWESGFQRLGWRKFTQGYRGEILQPTWQGESLRGKTLLVQGELGQGDMLLFARFLRPALHLAKKVYFRGSETLLPLLETMPGLETVSLEAPLPVYDKACLLLDLPALLGLRPLDCPPPYLQVEPLNRAPLEVPFRARVGFCWHGQLPERQPLPTAQRMAARKQIPLAAFIPVFQALPELAFFSLQWPEEPELALYPGLFSLAGSFENWLDTARAMAALDLVISADTAIAHLAGALGKPVFLLLPEPAYWLWPERGSDFDWYPRLRIFRQSLAGDWSDPMAELSMALREGFGF
ncbi:hypothetical protein COW36_18635 [bacterium (Candidatus Blackallbacteria) CG17_big_fil_post_rev_8_21_14_2_50_48_46]|uniref:Uncharacterized protein n=1 Tax=bacterium (Candidatus Blackallbacteria) CG17_big_fil_post_rev_8_21_14_2_50_48_46 TaxID=2014261 RepID=A0A2M7G149_9BACT|nr:MAG: hypothetical protein COW64_00100 [bacterium (Candidatus Blackallbacteria) CG18_big_fil_WC_8_21_14_2_50_49_26]PIW15431.1 MAG: hypothetical protein COW36_18635 [bacterium (Candidatus Blackallbacteria) CG17_big_fil_post_rev_8_21_14_2_50_48_46]PIW49708.1 MAG: hypothetical protein COW20_04730 [bacterium (Candidatus Blackallbacteria) CG13_big_fil_rev_8_21_14_2_50_49_14]